MTAGRPDSAARGAALGLLVLVGAGAGSAADGASPEIGRRIYLEGRLPGGEPLHATAVGGPGAGSAADGAACAACHRRSGFGTAEGGLYVPPVTGPALFDPRRPDRAELFRRLYQEVPSRTLYSRARDPRVRAAYTVETLAAALREGHDPSGRRLDPLMPRYRMSDAAVAHLAAYLRTLGAAPDPGVDGTTLHLATVVTAGVDPGERAALLAVMGAYVRRKNEETAGLLARPGSSPWHHDDFRDTYRRWQLHLWEPTGAPESWPAQLEARYRERPVFALVGGLAFGPWDPIHRFCEAAAVPCLFPHTDLPVTGESGDYSLYLSPGVAVEAAVLARHLRDRAGRGAPVPVTQIFRADPRGRALAAALRASLAGEPGIILEDRPVPDSQGGEAEAPRQEAPELVLWLTGPDLRALAAAGRAGDGQRVYLSDSLLGGRPEAIPAELGGEVFVVSRFAWPAAAVPRAYRVRAWLRSRGIEPTHERLQLDTFFALSVTEHALSHLAGRFSRDYLVERIEHETENALSPGVYPRLGLGPGQRFASKGAQVLRRVPDPPGLEAVTGWIVP